MCSFNGRQWDIFGHEGLQREYLNHWKKKYIHIKINFVPRLQSPPDLPSPQTLILWKIFCFFNE